MCTAIWAEKDGHPLEINTVGEFAAYIGDRKKIIFWEGKDYGDDTCLCNVEIEETLKKAGIDFERDDVMADYYIPSVTAVYAVC